MEISKIAAAYVIAVLMNIFAAEIYGRLLSLCGRMSGIWKEISATLVYALLVGYMFMLLAAPYEILGIEQVFEDAEILRWPTIFLYFTSMLPAFVFFKRRHFKKLKSMGFLK